jgi:hypothetical protein
LEAHRVAWCRPAKGRSHLRLHAADSRDTEVRRLTGNIVQQRCLADAGLTADDERRALTGPDSIDQPAQLVAFGATAL